MINNDERKLVLLHKSEPTEQPWAFSRVWVCECVSVCECVRGKIQEKIPKYIKRDGMSRWTRVAGSSIVTPTFHRTGGNERMLMNTVQWEKLDKMTTETKKNQENKKKKERKRWIKVRMEGEWKNEWRENGGTNGGRMEESVFTRAVGKILNRLFKCPQRIFLLLLHGP